MTLDQQIKCVKLEIERRKRVLPKLVEEGRYSEAGATHEIECMRAVFQTLSQLKGILTS
jgi:hypothetical protein